MHLVQKILKQEVFKMRIGREMVNLTSRDKGKASRRNKISTSMKVGKCRICLEKMGNKTGKVMGGYSVAQLTSDLY